MVAARVDHVQNDDPRTSLAGLIRASFHLVAKHPYACHIYQHDFNYLRTLPRYALLDEMAKDGERSWLDLLNEGATQGQFRREIETQAEIRTSADAVEGRNAFLEKRAARFSGR